MNKFWRDDIEKARSEAKAENKFLVLEYDAALDGDFVSAMTPEEFEAEKAKYQKRGIYGGWITVSEDYTQKSADTKEEMAEETVTVKSFILSNLLRGAKDRLEKLAQMGAPEIMLTSQKKAVEKLEAGNLKISGDTDLLGETFVSFETRNGKGGKQYVHINGSINFFPNSRYGMFITRA